MPPHVCNPDVWQFDLETGVRVASKVGEPLFQIWTRQAFGLSNYSLCTRRTDRRTDGRTKATLIAPFPTVGGITSLEGTAWKSMSWSYPTSRWSHPQNHIHHSRQALKSPHLPVERDRATEHPLGGQWLNRPRRGARRCTARCAGCRPATTNDAITNIAAVVSSILLATVATPTTCMMYCQNDLFHHQ